MAGRLTDLAGSSAYVLGGLVVVLQRGQDRLAGVPEALIEAHGAVSPEVATALSAGARSRLAPTSGSGSPGSPARAAGRRRSRSAPSASRSRRATDAEERDAFASRRPRRRPRPHDHGRPPHAPRCCCGYDAGARRRAAAPPLRRARPAGCRPRRARRASAPPPIPPSGAPSRPRRCTSRSPSSAPARRSDVAPIAPIVAAEHAGAARSRSATSLLLPPRRARVLTVALVDPSGALGALQARVSDALAARRRLHAGEAPVPPARHASPGCARARAPRAPPTLAPRSARNSAPTAVTLYASRLHPSGARYEALAPRTPLGYASAAHGRHHGPEGRSSRAARAGRAPRPPERRAAPRSAGAPASTSATCAARPSTSRSIARASIPGSVDLRIGRAGKTSGPTLMYLSGGPGGAGLSEMLERRHRAARARAPLPADRLRPARHRPLRAAALPAAREATRTCATPRRARTARTASASPASTTRPRTPSRTWRRSGPQLGVEKLTLFGISYGTELAIAYARAYPQHVERLILDSVVDPDDTDPYFTVDLPRHGPVAAVALPGPLPRASAPTPAATSASSSPSCARSRWWRAPTTTAGARTRSRSRPLELIDLMLVTDYIPPLRAIAADRRPLRAGRRRRAAGAHDPRLEPRSTCSARRATSRPPATPRSARPSRCRGTRARRSTSGPRSSSSGSRALPADTFAPVRPAGRRRGRDRPLPALAGRPAPALDRRAAAVSDGRRR